MRRGILFLLILVALVFFAWQVVLKPKPAKSKTSKKTKEVKPKTEKTIKKRSKRSGRLKKLTKEERKAEKALKRAERKRRREELRRRKREERLAKRAARRKRGKSGRKSKKGLGAYILQAIIWYDVGPSYAMIDGRRFEVGDVISGRKIVTIKPDQIVVDYRGNKSVIRMGESVLPSGYFSTVKRRRM
ncbi:MAG: hypothetical protein ACETVX_01995 [bacterium]|nr:hypothetical protein [candidate division WOR-3 bacterium]MDH5682902.1 hypothetical protein [candidate division WOR-3 bacterium]